MLSSSPHSAGLFPVSLLLVLLLSALASPKSAFALNVGDQVIVQNVNPSGLRIRSGPGTSYGQLGKVYDGATGTILSGPSSANGYTWVRVDWDDSGSPTGWSATGNSSTAWIVEHTSPKPDITSVSDASASEGNTLTFTVRLSGNTGQTETYYYSTYYGREATATGGNSSRRDYRGAAQRSVRVNSGRSSFPVRISTIEDTTVEGDETFYLYVTGSRNHPNSTPGPSKYRAIGTILNDDEASVIKPNIASVSDASASEGDILTFTVRLSGRTRQIETYYYSTYYGREATATGGNSSRRDYRGAAQKFVRISSGRSSFTVRVSTIEDTTVEGDETFYLYVTGSQNHPNSTPGPSKYRATGTIQDDDAGSTLGRHTYRFSLSGKTYTVASDNCYDRAKASQEEYISGLRIYNNRNEPARPTSSILFQLTAAHASACMIDGINLGERLNEINNLISYAQVYDKALRQISGLSRASSLLADSYGFEDLRQSVDALPTEGLIDLAAVGKIGLNMVQGVLSFLGGKALSEKQQMAVDIVSENFFGWPEMGLGAASDIYIEAKTIDLSGTINVAALRDQMKALDAARDAIEIAKLSIPHGWDLAKLMYPNLEGSVADVTVDLAVSVAPLLDPTGLIGATTFLIDAIKLRIHFETIEKVLLTLVSLQLDFRQSPFDTFQPNGTPVLTLPIAPYVVDGGSGWIRLWGLFVSDADNDNLRLAVAVKYGQLRASSTMVVDLDVSTNAALSDAVEFRRGSPSSINAALKTLEYRPPQNWGEDRDLLFLLVTDNKVQTPVTGIVPISPATQGVSGGCAGSMAVAGRPSSLVADCDVLLAVKDKLRGTAPLNWSPSLAIGSWAGVTVTNGRVTGLDLRRAGLTGTIPTELGSLSGLTELSLDGNQLTGCIPRSLGRFSSTISPQQSGRSLEVCDIQGTLENPKPGSFQSGIGIISGWVCEADLIEVTFENGTTGAVTTEPVGYGTSRADTADKCGDSNNGFGLLFNWNRLGDGQHTVRVSADGEEFARSTFTVTTLGEEFRRGLSKEVEVLDFPTSGEVATLQWQEAQQNFVLVSNRDSRGGSNLYPLMAALENPAPGSYQSGIGIISGWVCEADLIEVTFENGTTGAVTTEPVGYGTSRADTADKCGDSNNGFGLLFNWNRLGDGQHTVRVSADGEEFAWSAVTVTTLGEEFRRGLSKEVEVLDFPTSGEVATLQWQEAQQNFVLVRIIGDAGAPDLVVGSPSVSVNPLTPEQAFTLSVTVRNRGTEASPGTTLRYYRSSDATITRQDTQLDTDRIGGVNPSSVRTASASLTAPSTAGIYYYGACVDGVTNESDTTNNCSSGVRVTVGEATTKPDISSVGNASVTEGNTLTFTVRLSGITTQRETYYYSAYNGTAESGDYAAADEQAVQVPSGSNSFTIQVRTNQDADTDDETLYLYVTSSRNHPNSTPGSSQYRATGTIRDDDSSTDDHSNTRSGATSLSVGGSQSGQIETGNDVDYFRVQVSGSGELTVYTTGSLDTVGRLENSSGSSLSNDDDSGNNSNFRIAQTVSTGTYYVKVESYESNTGSYTLHASFSATSPTPQVSIADASATEGNSLSFTVTLSPAPTQSVTYYYATYQGTARGSGQDYQGHYATALTFSSGQTSRTISVSTIDDSEDESDEQFYVYITDASSKHPNSGTPSDSLASATGTIRDNDDSSPTPDDCVCTTANISDGFWLGPVAFIAAGRTSAEACQRLYEHCTNTPNPTTNPGRECPIQPQPPNNWDDNYRENVSASCGDKVARSRSQPGHCNYQDDWKNIQAWVAPRATPYHYQEFCHGSFSPP